MLGFLIVAVTLGLGVASGYGVRELISRRRRYRRRHGGRSPQPQAAPAGDLAINLDRLLVAANDDAAAARRRRQRAAGVEGSEGPDEFDGAVRDLLSGVNRRSSQPLEAAWRVRR